MPKAELFDHPKFKRLKRLINAPTPHVIGYLECLWRVGYQTGNPVIGDALDVESAAEFVGEIGAFAKAAHESGFLEMDSQGRYAIHDLFEHAPSYVKKRMVRKGTGKWNKDSTISIMRKSERSSAILETVRTDTETPVSSPNGQENPGLVSARETKKREERRENSPLPPKGESVRIPVELETESFRASWGEWREHRRQIRAALTPKTEVKQLAMLAQHGPAKAIEIIQASITNGWRGLFPQAGKSPHSKPPPPPRQAVDAPGGKLPPEFRKCAPPLP